MLPAALPVNPDCPLVDEVRVPFRPCRREAVPEAVADELVGRGNIGRRVRGVCLEVGEPREERVVGDADGERV